MKQWTKWKRNKTRRKIRIPGTNTRNKGWNIEMKKDKKDNWLSAPDEINIKENVSEKKVKNKTKPVNLCWLPLHKGLER